MNEENRKKKIVNMNYPPDDMPLEEQERFWGTWTEEDTKYIEAAKKVAIEALGKGKSHARPSPV